MSALPFVWDGNDMCPKPGFAKRCDAAFVIGETYLLEPVEERSVATHRHYFAAINEAWGNLPENMASEFPTPEHLRKTALIRSGYADQRELVASSKAEALRLVAFVRPMDEYAIVQVEGCVVRVWTAQSQSQRAMGKAKFQESKQKVLDYVAGLIGVAPESLTREAGRAA